ncbi:MAG: hypothetical protein U0835_18505 [Isosphaeraceae bacterium]
MAVIRSTLIFAAGVAVGAAGRDALPRLKEKFGPQLQESLGPLAAAAAAGVRDAVGDACSDVARNVSQTIDSARERAARQTASPTA